MRVTPQMVSQRFIKNMHKSNEAIANLQGQISSGRKFEKISDNPSVTLQGLNHRSSWMQIEQYQKNVQNGTEWLTATDDALGNATEVLQRVRELTVQASNDSNSEIVKQNIASEIRNLKEQLGTIANTRLGGQYLFAGNDTNTPPYQNGTIYNSGQSGMVWSIGQGQTVKINVTSDLVFGREVNGKNIFATIDSLIQGLENGENPNSYLSLIDIQMDNVITQRAIVGANQNLLELATNKLDQANFLTQKIWSEKEGTDVAKSYMELSAHETVLKASLTVGSKIMPITLADFLR
jgi:flagellar hook-associated protein 3 FlgL